MWGSSLPSQGFRVPGSEQEVLGRSDLVQDAELVHLGEPLLQEASRISPGEPGLLVFPPSSAYLLWVAGFASISPKPLQAHQGKLQEAP